MDIIYIRKQMVKGADGEAAHFVTPAVTIATAQGQRFIPHPFGSETAIFETLDEAVSATHRAGYDAEYEGKRYPRTEKTTNKSVKRIQQRSATQANAFAAVESVIPQLIERLSDNHPNVVASAAFAIGEIRHEGAISALLHCFGHDDATVRKNAGIALAKLGSAGLPAIHQSLKDKHWLVRHSGLVAIGELVHLQLSLVPELLLTAQELLSDDNWIIRSQAATLFGEATRALNEREEKQKNTPQPMR